MKDKVSVILPCHNEEKIIKKAVNAILNQTHQRLEVVIAFDNCTDKTIDIAIENFSHNSRVRFFKSKRNKFKKSGVLNQLFDVFWSYLGDYILIMDADTIIHCRSIEEGVRHLNKAPKDGVVCSKAGVLKNSKNLIWHIQNIEYGRFDTDRIETEGFCMVAHGMFSMYRKEVLEKVKLKRKYIYDIHNITEDYELTLFIKQLGYKIGNNLNIKAYTEVPLKFKEYWIQRERWSTGGLKAIASYKMNKHTYRDKIKNYLFVTVLAAQIYIGINNGLVLGIGFYAVMLLSLINSIMRYKYVTHKSKFSLLLTISLIPDIFISWVNMLVMIKSYINNIMNKEMKWR